jgi:predicted nucleic acid-binding protein
MIEWGKLVVRHKQTLPALDSLLATTCLTHHFTLLTRNVKDFTHIAGIGIINQCQQVKKDIAQKPEV